MLLRFFLIATACFSCSPPDINFLVIYFIPMYMHNDHCHRVTAQLQLINIIFYFFYFGQKTFVAKLIKKKTLSGTRALRRGVWMIGGVNPHILKLGNGWRWMSSFMPIALSPRKSPLWSVRLTASLSNILLWSVKLTASLSKVDEQLHAKIALSPRKSPLVPIV